MSNYNLRSLYLKDALDLFESFGEDEPEFAQNSSGRVSVNSVRINISKFLEGNNNFAFVWEEEKFVRDDVQNLGSTYSKNLIYIFCTQSFLSKGELNVEIYIPKEFLSEEADITLNYDGFIDSFLDLLANNDRVQVINLKIPDFYTAFTSTLLNYGFVESDVSINLGNKLLGSRNIWKKTFVMDKLSNWPSTWAFVPTDVAIFAIYGNEDRITQTRFIYYSEYLEDISLRSLCINNELADANGYVLNDFDVATARFSEDFTNLPSSLKLAIQQSKEYFSGERKIFNLPLVFDNFTNFQKLVWNQTLEIPYGSVSSYEDLAVALTNDTYLNPASFSRAVGQALSSNPLVVFIPCHRIIAKNGNLQGYKYDIKIKDWLLTKEMLCW